MNDQLALIPSLPVHNADPLLLTPRVASDVSPEDINAAFDMCNNMAAKYGWQKVEAKTPQLNNRMRDRLCEQRKIDGIVYTGLELLTKVLRNIEVNDFLRERKRNGMSVLWIIGRQNFEKVALGELGGDKNGRKSVSKIAQAFMDND